MFQIIKAFSDSLDEVLINQFTDIVSFSHSRQLEIIMSSLSAGQLAKIKRLDLRTSNVNSLEPLVKCTNLRQLYISYTRITDLELLESLPNLTCLYIDGLAISDFRILQKLTKLEELELCFTQINKLTDLKNCHKLHTLCLGATKVDSLTGIENCKDMRNLCLYDTKITDLSLLVNFSNLNQLSLQGTPLKIVNKSKLLKAMLLSFKTNPHISFSEKLRIWDQIIIPELLKNRYSQKIDIKILIKDFKTIVRQYRDQSRLSIASKRHNDTNDKSFSDSWFCSDIHQEIVSFLQPELSDEEENTLSLVTQ